MDEGRERCRVTANQSDQRRRGGGWSKLDSTEREGNLYTPALPLPTLLTGLVVMPYPLYRASAPKKSEPWWWALPWAGGVEGRRMVRVGEKGAV